jgi:phosphate transport system substrate-binding protein
MRAVPILWEGHMSAPVGPSLENVLAGTYNPLSRPLFIYVNKKSAEEKPWVGEFVQFYLDHAAELVAEVKYVPLPDRAYAMAKERYRKREVGTGFGGEPEVGLPIEEILQRKPRH